MVDRVLLSGFVVANESGEDRQSRRVGRRPTRGAKRVRAKVEHGAGPGVPARAAVLRIGRIQLIQLPRVDVDDEYVPIAARAGSAFDRRVGRDWIRTRVALISVVE